MTLSLRLAVLITASLATACGGASPTAPTSNSTTAMAPPEPPSPPPVPAPVSQTLTGTWFGSGQSFTVTQNGTSVSGMMRETTRSLGNGMVLTDSTSITGTVSGNNVTLLLDDRMMIVGAGKAQTCTAGHTFTGTLSGNTLSGMIVAGTTPLDCGNDPPAIQLPITSGPATYTRQ